MKKTIRLTESDFRRLVERAAMRMLKESRDDDGLYNEIDRELRYANINARVSRHYSDMDRHVTIAVDKDDKKYIPVVERIMRDYGFYYYTMNYCDRDLMVEFKYKGRPA